MNEIVRSLHIPGDHLTDDFVIFQKGVLDVHDHYRFWLRIIQDHMTFISKRSELHKATAVNYLTQALQLKAVATTKDQIDFNQYNEQVIQLIEQVRDFKRLLLDGLLKDVAPPVLLPPTLISHMLNELEKFRFIAHYIKTNGEFPPVYSLNEHELWLADIVGHLGGIKDNLDDIEKIIRKRLHEHKEIFHKLHNKSLEFIGYIKHEVLGEKSLNRLNQEAQVGTLSYLHLVREITELLENKEILGIIDKQMLIHMIFEELYYLKSLDSAINFYDPLQCSQIKQDLKSQQAIASMLS